MGRHATSVYRLLWASECATWQRTTERFQGEDKLCLTKESEVSADNIGLGEVSKTENDIYEFAEFMEDYLASPARLVKYWISMH
jgi:hypothetical protein